MPCAGDWTGTLCVPGATTTAQGLRLRGGVDEVWAACRIPLWWSHEPHSGILAGDNTRVKPGLLTLVLAGATMAARAADPNSTKAGASAADFKVADVNRSGGLSQVKLGVTKPQQFADIKKGFAKMDANRDPQVTLQEYTDSQSRVSDSSEDEDTGWASLLKKRFWVPTTKGPRGALCTIRPLHGEAGMSIAGAANQDLATPAVDDITSSWRLSCLRRQP